MIHKIKRLSVFCVLFALCVGAVKSQQKGDTAACDGGRRLVVGGYGEAVYSRHFYSDNVFRYSFADRYAHSRGYGRADLPEDSVIITSLLHDVCKADIYRPTVKRQKTAFGNWEDVPGYDVDYSNFPLGHGEKSVIVLLLNGLDLTDNEILAIRWHMSAWDLPFQSNDIKSNYNVAKDRCPLIALIQAADGLASNIIERSIHKDLYSI